MTARAGTPAWSWCWSSPSRPHWPSSPSSYTRSRRARCPPSTTRCTSGASGRSLTWWTPTNWWRRRRRRSPSRLSPCDPRRLLGTCSSQANVSHWHAPCICALLYMVCIQLFNNKKKSVSFGDVAMSDPTELELFSWDWYWSDWCFLLLCKWMYIMNHMLFIACVGHFCINGTALNDN